MRYSVHENEVSWQPHSKFNGVEIKVLHTGEEGALATIVITKVPEGATVPVHVHEESDDILFVLSGSAKLEIDKVGIFEMVKGSSLRVPKNTRHQIYDVTQELILYDVFAPPAF